MTKKKVLFLTIASFAIVAIFNLALVSQVKAAVELGGDCATTGNGITGCDTLATGNSCQANPYKGCGSSSCSAYPSWAFNANSFSRVCCSKMWGCLGEAGVGTATGLSNKDPREIAANVVNVLLGFLGIIAVVLILIGGFMWMTSAGSEEKTGTAKKIMSAGVIGLVIVLAAFGIAKFVISAMITATTK